MKPEEAVKILGELSSKRQSAYEALVAPAKAAANVLKDHGQHSTARDLEAALFSLDAIEGETMEAIKANPRVFLEAISRNLGGH